MRVVADQTTQSWTAKHFSQANPRGEAQANVPQLLRRVAKTIEGLGEVDVLDIVMHTEITEQGDWHQPDRIFQ